MLFLRSDAAHFGGRGEASRWLRTRAGALSPDPGVPLLFESIVNDCPDWVPTQISAYWHA
jgi:hypothetical protein